MKQLLDDETIIRVPNGKLCLNFCDYCLGQMSVKAGGSRIGKNGYRSIKLRYGEVVAKDLDDVYLHWLIIGHADMIRLWCPHERTEKINRFYLKTNGLKLHLGEDILTGVKEYPYCALVIRLNDGRISRLSNHYWHLRHVENPDQEWGEYIWQV